MMANPCQRNKNKGKTMEICYSIIVFCYRWFTGLSIVEKWVLDTIDITNYVDKNYLITLRVVDG